MMTLPFLETLGLSQKESEIYELLLKLGETPAGVIIKNTGLKRATTYKVLASLEKHGLVTHKEIEKIIRFKPEPPTQLTALAENQYQNLERAKEMLKTVLPQLISSYTLSVEKPIIRVYEGVEGVKQAHLELLAEKKNISAYVKINPKIDDNLGKFWSKYYQIRKQDHIMARVISENTPAGRAYQKNDKKELRQTLLVPPKMFNINIEKDIVGDKVAFFSSQDNKLIVTIIENKEIAEAEQSIFDLLWKAKKSY